MEEDFKNTIKNEDDEVFVDNNNMISNNNSAKTFIIKSGRALDSIWAYFSDELNPNRTNQSTYKHYSNFIN
jgi:hypothetical protein